MGILQPGKDDTTSIGRQPGIASSDRREIADGRGHRLEQLFREHAGRVLDYARYRGATLDEAEDVVSEVFIVLTRRLDEAPLAPDEMVPWLLGVARKVLANQLRSYRRRQALAERSGEAITLSGPSEDDLPEIATHSLIVRQSLAKLREKEREALLLVTWDGFQYDEAARILGCSPGALAQRVLRARRLLLEEIGDIRTYRDIESNYFSRVEAREE